MTLQLGDLLAMVGIILTIVIPFIKWLHGVSQNSKAAVLELQVLNRDLLSLRREKEVDHRNLWKAHRDDTRDLSTVQERVTRVETEVGGIKEDILTIRTHVFPRSA